ncbi:hypothetical protein HanRHA438_Chr10g0474171 [Helianthus annuus]|nr:hypothetical protein HanRHA438_Chr10g0474171 [Helianthus annuus]
MDFKHQLFTYQKDRYTVYEKHIKRLWVLGLLFWLYIGIKLVFNFDLHILV